MELMDDFISTDAQMGLRFIVFSVVNFYWLSGEGVVVIFHMVVIFPAKYFAVVFFIQNLK